jgi:GT2 family glycosyltransferase
MERQAGKDSTVPLTVAIPTYGREQILIQTLQYLRELPSPPAEILVLDQTAAHSPDVLNTLETWHGHGVIRWHRIPKPSITGAMNHGLLKATHEIVLFVDDDIIPEPDLLTAHVAAHKNTGAALIAGRVIQPWQKGVDFSRDETFHFASMRSQWADEFIGCNFSVQRDIAITLGGFDENFVRVAYHFEAEFAHRLRQAGYRIYFEPGACIHHLRIRKGGTRSFGDHLKTFKPNHTVGLYYHALSTWEGRKSLKELLRQPLMAVWSRHHLRRPWWIPPMLLAHLSGFCWAFVLFLGGPRYIAPGK